MLDYLRLNLLTASLIFKVDKEITIVFLSLYLTPVCLSRVEQRNNDVSFIIYLSIYTKKIGNVRKIDNILWSFAFIFKCVYIFSHN